MNWACDAFNRTATEANSGNRSPHEMIYRETSQSSPMPFLKPGFSKFKRTNKIFIEGHQRHGQRGCCQQDIHTWRGHRKRAQAAVGGWSQASTTPTAGEQQQRWQPPQHG